MVKNEILVHLAKEVILPIVTILDKKLNLSTKESLNLIKKLHITYIAVIPFKKNIDEKELITRFLYLEEIYKIGLNKEDAKKILKKFYSSLKEFMKKYNIKENRAFNIFFESLIKYHMDEDLINEYRKNEEFFEIDNEGIDKNIEKMHYNEEQKINAKEFMDEETIEKGVTDELKELLEEYYHLTFDKLNEDYLEKFKFIIEEFIKIFNYSFEFKDLAYGLQNLVNLLNKIDIQNNKELIKLLLDSVMEDLNKFYYSVFINQNAVDIHYLDASLLANIAQIEIILNQTKGE